MLFNTPEFLLFFIAIFCLFLLLYLFLPQWIKPYLVIGSFLFYGDWNWKFVPLLAGSVVFNFIIYKIMEKRTERSLKIKYRNLGILGNLLLLAFFKYFNFFLDNLNGLAQMNIPHLEIVLPLGISFFTFQQIAFLFDAAEDEAKGVKLTDYGLFVTFFPQLIAGPIVHHKEMMPQFSNLKISQDKIAQGCALFSFGLAKKVLLADNLAGYVAKAFENTPDLTFIDAWCGALAYAFQLYFDFSGYCEMALGLGLILGIRLPINFNSPYKASDIQDFWRRWHITLSRWLRDYLYIPLGGNRRGRFRTALNAIAVFTLGGLWHGASWTFVLWGAMHGLALAVSGVWRRVGRPFPGLVGNFITFIFVTVAWVMFRADSVAGAFQYYQAMLGSNGMDPPGALAGLTGRLANIPGAAEAAKHPVLSLELLILLVGSMVIVFFSKNALERSGFSGSGQSRESYEISHLNIILTGALLAFTVSFLKAPSEFIYFNF